MNGRFRGKSSFSQWVKQRYFIEPTDISAYSLLMELTLRPSISQPPSACSEVDPITRATSEIPAQHAHTNQTSVTNDGYKISDPELGSIPMVANHPSSPKHTDTGARPVACNSDLFILRRPCDSTGFWVARCLVNVAKVCNQWIDLAHSSRSRFRR